MPQLPSYLKELFSHHSLTADVSWDIEYKLGLGVSFWIELGVKIMMKLKTVLVYLNYGSSEIG